MSKGYKRQKRNYLINKDLQGKLGLQILLLAIAGMVFLGILFAFSSADHLTISYNNNKIDVGSTPSVLLVDLLRSEGIFLLVGGLLIIAITIFLTHKIAGPIYRFEQTLKAMCSRQLDQGIYLRKGDEGRELGTLINDLNLLLTEDILEIKDIASRLADSEEKTRLVKLTERYQLPVKTLNSD